MCARPNDKSKDCGRAGFLCSKYPRSVAGGRVLVIVNSIDGNQRLVPGGGAFLIFMFIFAAASPCFARFESGRSLNALMYCFFAAGYIREFIAESAAVSISCIFLTLSRYDAAILEAGAFGLRTM